MTADFTQRNSVSKELDAGVQQQGSACSTGTSSSEKRNGTNETYSTTNTNDNENESYSNNNDHGSHSLPESYDNDQTTAKEPTSLNGNDNDPPCDDNNTSHLSTLDRRKMFENRLSVGSDVGNNETNGDSFEDRKPRKSVAERMKMFQQKTGGSAGEEENNSSHSNNSHNTTSSHPKITTMSSEDSSSGQDDQIEGGGKDREPCPAPIAKPERKFTPPKQESTSNVRKIEKVESTPVQNSVSKPATSNKRIDTVFGQVSKYRNFKAAPLHKKMHIENLRNISTTCPGESELIQGK